MIEALKYIFFSVGVVVSTIAIVFVCCFCAWAFDKWRKER